MLACHTPDISDKLNGLNPSLQGQNATVFHLSDKVSAYIKKTMLRKSLCGSEIPEMYVNMSEYTEENDYAFEEIKPHILTDFISPYLETNFKYRFPELTFQQHGWIPNSFSVTVGEKK